MNRLLIFLIVLMTLCSSFHVAEAAAGDEAQRLFDSIYGSRVKAAMKTLDRDDDVKMAEELLAAAKSSANAPAMRVCLCNASFDLGGRHKEGYAAAVEAMMLLTDVATERDAAFEKLVTVLNKQYRAGNLSERDGAAQDLFKTYLAIGDINMKASKWRDAVIDFRRALALAVSRKLPQLGNAKARLQLALQREKAARQIAMLSERLLKDATDAKAAEQIVQMYMVEFDDPASAVPFLNRVENTTLKKLVPLAAGSMAGVSEQASLELGFWYQQHIGTANARGDLPMLDRTIGYLRRYLDLHQASDLNANRAAIALKQATESRAKIIASSGEVGPSVTGKTASNTPSVWRIAWELNGRLTDPEKNQLPHELAVDLKRGSARITGSCKHDAGHFFGRRCGHFGKVVTLPSTRLTGTLRVAVPSVHGRIVYLAVLREKDKPGTFHSLKLDGGGVYAWKLAPSGDQMHLIIARGRTLVLDVKVPAATFDGFGFGATVRYVNQNKADLAITWK